MSDLVERLRYLARVFRKHDEYAPNDYELAATLPDEAANEIERLREAVYIDDLTVTGLADDKIAAKSEIERLRAALTGIKRAGKARMESYGDEHSYYYVTAVAALEQTPIKT